MLTCLFVLRRVCLFFVCSGGKDLTCTELTLIFIIISAEPTESEKDLTKIKVSLLERNRNPHISSHLPLTPSSVFFSGIVGDIDKNNRLKTADKTKVITLQSFHFTTFSPTLKWNGDANTYSVRITDMFLRISQRNLSMFVASLSDCKYFAE